MTLLFILFLGCAGQPQVQEPQMVRAEWKRMQPPRIGLRCWYSALPTYGVSYCESDPNSTHGASP